MLDLAKHECNGCGACRNACPEACISMPADEKGFRYPLIDETKCIQCGACEAACPVITPLMTYEGEPPAEAAYYNNDSFRPYSASGGIFPLLAELVMSRGGEAFGASFSTEMYLRHRRAESRMDVFKLQGAKYVQSDTQLTFQEVRTLLQEGKWVLFGGTPCQIEGLLAFLGREYETLITMDFICWGVSSPVLFDAYLEGMSKDYGGRVVSFRARDKFSGYQKKMVKVLFKPEQKIYMPENKNHWLQLYKQGYGMRPACRSCLFRKEHHVADFTVSDLWSTRELDMDDDRGISLVQINTDQGQVIWQECGTLEESGQRLLVHEPYSAEKERISNKGFTENPPLPPDEEQLFADLGKKRFRKVADQYTGQKQSGGFWQRLLGRRQ